jgi:hypothetical protein
LGVTEAAAAISAMAQQVDIDNRVLNLAAATMLVPSGLRFIGSQLLTSEQLSRIATGDQLPRGNPISTWGIDLKAEARLDRESQASWYMFSSPIWASMIVGFLNGREGVNVEQAPEEADVLAVNLRAYMDGGVSLGDWRAAVKSKSP